MSSAGALLAAVGMHAWIFTILLYTLASYVSWWQWLIVVVVRTGVRAHYHWLAEKGRRETLKVLVENACNGTVILQEKGVGGPAVTVLIGAKRPPDQGALA